jgi:hypothetical protein
MLGNLPFARIAGRAFNWRMAFSSFSRSPDRHGLQQHFRFFERPGRNTLHISTIPIDGNEQSHSFIVDIGGSPNPLTPGCLALSPVAGSLFWIPCAKLQSFANFET